MCVYVYNVYTYVIQCACVCVYPLYGKLLFSNKKQIQTSKERLLLRKDYCRFGGGDRILQ